MLDVSPFGRGPGKCEHLHRLCSEIAAPPPHRWTTSSALEARLLHEPGKDQAIGAIVTVHLAPQTQLRLDASSYYGHYSEWQLASWRLQVTSGSLVGSCVELIESNDCETPLAKSPPGLVAVT